MKQNVDEKNIRERRRRRIINKELKLGQQYDNYKPRTNYLISL